MSRTIRMLEQEWMMTMFIVCVTSVSLVSKMRNKISSGAKSTWNCIKHQLARPSIPQIKIDSYS